jgi:transcription-repair coupling factor (superfamily II helicase)
VQSGHIDAVGFDLYAQLVGEAVGELTGGPAPTTEPVEVRIDLPVDAHLPEAWIADAQARLEAYRRLAAAATDAEVDDVADEWTDRFGELPAEAESLIAIARLRSAAVRVGLTEVVKLRNEVRMGPVDFTDAQEVRFRRLSKRRGVFKPNEGVVFFPAPRKDEMVPALIAFMNDMWPPSTDGAA